MVSLIPKPVLAHTSLYLKLYTFANFVAVVSETHLIVNKSTLFPTIITFASPHVSDIKSNH